MRLARVGALVLGLLLGVVGVAGCTEEESPQLRNCEAGAPAEWESCYGISAKELHCVLETLREYHAQGRYELGELPDWAITEMRNGAPIIYDLRATESPFAVPGDATGLLKQWAEQRNLEIDDGEIARCEQSVTEAEIRQVEGGGAKTSEWDFEEPVTRP